MVYLQARARVRKPLWAQLQYIVLMASGLHRKGQQQATSLEMTMSITSRRPLCLFSLCLLLLPGACGEGDPGLDRVSSSSELDFKPYNDCVKKILGSYMFYDLDRRQTGHPVAAVDLPTVRVGEHSVGGKIVFFMDSRKRGFWFISNGKARRYLFSSISSRVVETDATATKMFDFSLSGDVDRDGVQETTFYFSLAPQTSRVTAATKPGGGIEYTALTQENREDLETFDPAVMEGFKSELYWTASYQIRQAAVYLSLRAMGKFAEKYAHGLLYARSQWTTADFPDSREYQESLSACIIPSDKSFTEMVEAELAAVKAMAFPTHGLACEKPEQWRCVYDEVFKAEISQVCRRCADISAEDRAEWKVCQPVGVEAKIPEAVYINYARNPRECRYCYGSYENWSPHSSCESAQ